MNQSVVKKQQMEYFSLVILMISSVIFRFLISDIGIGYIMTAFCLYEFLWLILGKRFSEIVGRIIRGKITKGKSKAARVIWKYGFYMQLFTGAAAMLLLAGAGSYMLVHLFGYIHSYYLVWFFAVIFFIRMLSEAFCAYLAGKNYELLGGVAALLRQVIILVLGIFISLGITGYGNKVGALLKQADFGPVYGGIGILIGALAAEILILVLLMMVRLGINNKTGGFIDDYYQKNDNNGNVFSQIWKRRAIECINLLLLFIPGMIIVVGLRNQFEDGFELARNLGLLFSAVIAPACIFIVFGYALILPLAAKAVSCIRRREMRHARTIFQTGFHLACVYGIFGCVYLMAEGKMLAYLLSAEMSQEISNLLIYAAFCVVLCTIAAYLLKFFVLVGQGFFAMLFQIGGCIIISIILNMLMSSDMSKMLAVMVSILVYLVYTVIALSIFAIFRLDMSIEPVGGFCIPVICGLICGIVNMFLAKGISPHLGYAFTVSFCFVESLFLYVTLLLLFRNFSEKELEYMPGKRLIRALGQMFHVL